jgi:hypothetical protein
MALGSVVVEKVVLDLHPESKCPFKCSIHVYRCIVLLRYVGILTTYERHRIDDWYKDAHTPFTYLPKKGPQVIRASH